MNKLAFAVVPIAAVSLAAGLTNRASETTGSAEVITCKGQWTEKQLGGMAVFEAMTGLDIASEMGVRTNHLGFVAATLESERIIQANDPTTLAYPIDCTVRTNVTTNDYMSLGAKAENAGKLVRRDIAPDGAQLLFIATNR